MAQYIAFTPNVEVKGISILGIIETMGEEVIPIFEKHNLVDISPDEWYNQQEYLNAYKELAELNFMNLVAIGMKVPDHAVWPPHIKTVHDALASVNVAYQMNHRGGEIGSYDYTALGDQQGVMVCHNPYPSDFDYGLIYRIVQKFRTDERNNITVKRDNKSPNRLTGADSCTYHINW